MAEYIEREAKNTAGCSVSKKIRTNFAKIIVSGTSEKPYYEIMYFDPEKKEFCIGYSSYLLDYVFEWLQEKFEIISETCDADAAPVRHGRWDSSGKYRFQKDNSVAVRCTECGCSLTESEYRCNVWNYCPVCGAKMDLEV